MKYSSFTPVHRPGGGRVQIALNSYLKSKVLNQIFTSLHVLRFCQVFLHDHDKSQSRDVILQVCGDFAV